MRIPRELEIRLDIYRLNINSLTKKQIKEEISNCLESCYALLGQTTKMDNYYKRQIRELNQFKASISMLEDEYERI